MALPWGRPSWSLGAGLRSPPAKSGRVRGNGRGMGNSCRGSASCAGAVVIRLQRHHRTLPGPEVACERLEIAPLRRLGRHSGTRVGDAHTRLRPADPGIGYGDDVHRAQQDSVVGLDLHLERTHGVLLTLSDLVAESGGLQHDVTANRQFPAEPWAQLAEERNRRLGSRQRPLWPLTLTVPSPKVWAMRASNIGFFSLSARLERALHRWRERELYPT